MFDKEQKPVVIGNALPGPRRPASVCMTGIGRDSRLQMGTASVQHCRLIGEGDSGGFLCEQAMLRKPPSAGSRRHELLGASGHSHSLTYCQ